MLSQHCYKLIVDIEQITDFIWLIKKKKFQTF